MKIIINRKKKCSRCDGTGSGEPYDCHGEQYWHSCSDCDGDGFERIKIYTPKEQAKIDRQKKKEDAELQAHIKWYESHFDKKKLLRAAKKANFSIDPNLPVGYIRNTLVRNDIIPGVLYIDAP
jgi:hypothetical protein